MLKILKFCVSLFLFLLPLSCGIFKAKDTFFKKQNISDQRVENYIQEELQKPLNQSFIKLKDNKKLSKHRLAYIKKYAHISLREMIMYGIPASITLAQAILESSSGLSELSKKSNNHFGVKCHSDWQGDFTHYDDDQPQECFRKYSHPAQSYRDHSLFLATRKRYAFLFEYDMDHYKSWAKGLQKSGYATDKKYASKLIKLIKRYQLFVYDEMVLEQALFAKKKRKKKKDSKPTKIHFVKQGETLYTIAKIYKMTVQQLKRMNHLSSNNLSIGQRLLVWK